MFKPRYYQEISCENVLNAINNDQHPILILATGTGKTEVAAMVISKLNQKKKKVLFIAHRGFLLTQAEDKIYKHTDRYPYREQGKQRASWGCGNVTASVQTIKGKRLFDIPKEAVDVIIIDECHRATAKTYQDIFEHFSHAKRIGLTATADRPDKVSLYPTFTTIAYQYTLHKAIMDGFLCRIKGRRVKDFNIDLSSLKTNEKDFDDDELGTIIEKYLVPIANNIEKETQDRNKVLLFMPNVHSSKLIAETMREMKLKADCVFGDRDDNEHVLAQFSAGNIKYLASNNLLIEGYDEPSIDCVVMLRPTKSRIVFSQAVGRGTRLFQGKDYLRLLEFTYNSDEHDLVSSYELLEDNFDKKFIEEAKTLDPDGDLVEAIEEIKERFYSIDSIVGRAERKGYEFESFDPLEINSMLDIENTDSEAWFQGKKLEGQITEKQRELLTRYMIDTSEIDKSKASNVIDKIMSKNILPLNGMATESQKAYIKRLTGHCPGNITKAAAGLIITAAKERLCTA